MQTNTCLQLHRQTHLIRFCNVFVCNLVGRVHVRQVHKDAAYLYCIRLRYYIPANGRTKKARYDGSFGMLSDATRESFANQMQIRPGWWQSGTQFSPCAILRTCVVCADVIKIHMFGACFWVIAVSGKLMKENIKYGFAKRIV